MATPLHVLIIDHRADDAERMVRELRRGGFEPTWARVETEAAFRAALSPEVELILADDRPPGLDAERALALRRQRGLDVPFIVVSGTSDVERAVAAMKRGASDYLLKGRLARLGEAVAQALEGRRLDRAKRDAGTRRDRALAGAAPAGVVPPQGEVRVVREKAAIVPNAHDRPREIIGRLQDITQQRRAEQERQQLLTELRERLKELTALHDTAKLLQRPHKSVADLLERLVVLLPPALRFPDLAAARVTYGGVTRTTAGYRLVPDVLRTTFQTSDGAAGCIELVYHHEPPLGDDAPRFEPEEHHLLESVAEMLQNHLDRVQAEDKLRASEARFRTLAANLPGAVYRCAIDDKWSMSYLSDAVEKITGYAAAEFIHNAVRSFESLIEAPDDARSTAQIRQAIERREPFRMEYRIRHADGSIRWLYEQGQAAYDDQGRAVWLDGALFDITSLKHAEQVEEERNGLRRAIRAQEQVLGVVGHELRTPLAATRAMAELLLTDVKHVRGQARQFIQSIHDQVLRMAAMVNDLLEVARLNSGTARWNWGRVDVGRACDEAVACVRPLVDQQRVSLALDTPPEAITMHGDTGAVRRLVLNLVNNAAKFTPAGSIRVTAATLDDAEGKWVQVQVHDTGKGMTAETASRLGQAFALNSGVVGENHVKGAGLGLAICKGIVLAHGGTICVSSAVGRGTTVTARLRRDLPEPISDQADDDDVLLTSSA